MLALGSEMHPVPKNIDGKGLRKSKSQTLALTCICIEKGTFLYKYTTHMYPSHTVPYVYTTHMYPKLFNLM